MDLTQISPNLYYQEYGHLFYSELLHATHNFLEEDWYNEAHATLAWKATDYQIPLADSDILYHAENDS